MRQTRDDGAPLLLCFVVAALLLLLFLTHDFIVGDGRFHQGLCHRAVLKKRGKGKKEAGVRWAKIDRTRSDEQKEAKFLT